MENFTGSPLVSTVNAAPLVSAPVACGAAVVTVVERHPLAPRIIEQPQMDCVLPTFDLINTPSRKDKISAEDETDLRVIGCSLIQHAGIIMKQMQVRSIDIFCASSFLSYIAETSIQDLICMY